MNYKYIDKSLQYVYENGVLKNKAGILDADKLVVFESLMVAERLNSLLQTPIKIKNATDLLKIHKCLFQDVYDWAGKCRKVEISKSDKPFLQTQFFKQSFLYLDSLLSEYFCIEKSNKIKIANKLAIILDVINSGHFFREGNGRTQREFIRILALQKGYNLDLNPPENEQVYNDYMQGTKDGNIQLLEKLLSRLLK
ncbi:MAG: Fic family protein [Rickettsiales bacterium]|jgi:cell filamentation protein|nr:Fic family protein [Rickettsiales bacterium]